MGFNPYEMRWEVFQNAETRLLNRHEAEVNRWQSLQEKGEETGPYPTFPTEVEIKQVADNMLSFVEKAERK
jgi:hypothetical protein|tara:strand:+ start:557 stop:769 length:213 start_codon:yes stop_codon:yes gene_type:complete